MSRITVEHDGSYAPCALIICQVDDDGAYDMYDENKTRLADSDWDWPSLARDFGWVMSSDDCNHDCTDGTIKCPDCGKSSCAFIAEAYDYLLDHCGDIVDDPGYFN